jgi:hypothetical protein
VPTAPTLVVKREEAEPIKKPVIKKMDTLKKGMPKKDVPEGCNHYFGYLWTLPKGTSTPDECYCCTKLIDCYKETKNSVEI